jgi:hypothetical protein
VLRELVCFGGDEMFASNFMKAVQGYHLIKPEDLLWRPSNLMRIPNADFLERTGSENMGARLWRLPPKSANTLHKHIRLRAQTATRNHHTESKDQRLHHNSGDDRLGVCSQAQGFCR